LAGSSIPREYRVKYVEISAREAGSSQAKASTLSCLRGGWRLPCNRIVNNCFEFPRLIDLPFVDCRVVIQAVGGFEEELGSASTGIVIEGIIGGFEEGLTGASALSSVVNPGLCTHSDTVQTYYLVSQGKVLAEYTNLASGPSFTYIYAGDQRIGMRDSQNKLHFYLADHLGSTRVVFDSAGVVKDRYRYLAFGAPEAGQTIATNQPNRYTG
jgi:hypothetical protein